MDTQITTIRPLFDDSQLPCVIVEIVLYYVQLLCDGQYTWKDLHDIPIGVHSFTLNMTIRPFDFTKPRIIYRYCGKVDVIRHGQNSQFNFRYTVSENHYELINGTLFVNTGVLIFAGSQYGSKVTILKS